MTKRPFDTDKRFKRMILLQTTASIEISSINRELTLEQIRVYLYYKFLLTERNSTNA